MQHTVLIHAICEILQQCSTGKYYVVYFRNLNNAKNESSSSSIINGENTKSEHTDLELPACKEIESSAKMFHGNLMVQMYSMIGDVEKYYRENVESLKAQYGVLLFLYSVIATKVCAFFYLKHLFLNYRFKLQGIEYVKSESDTGDPLIDETYGHGSQSLINLMITGKAVTYVWDNFQDVGGLSKALLY